MVKGLAESSRPGSVAHVQGASASGFLHDRTQEENEVSNTKEVHSNLADANGEDARPTEVENTSGNGACNTSKGKQGDCSPV